MFEQLAIEQTPVAVQIYTQGYYEGPKTSSVLQERRAQVLKATAPTTLEAPIVANKVVGTATLADISNRRHSNPSGNGLTPKVHIESLVDKTVDDRVSLLAKKYAGKIDSEGSARLEILTERLNRLVPPIESSTIDRVADVVSVAQRSSPRLAALRAKYGSK